MESINKKNFEKKIDDVDLYRKTESFANDLGFRVSTEKPVYDIEQQNTERDFSINRLQAVFEKNNFFIANPMSIKLEDATTLFVSAGIQKLENTIHKEDAFPNVPLLINQPVIRSQFLGSKEIESHTSFHNITTIDININMNQHLNHLKKWIDFLLSSGFLKENFLFQIKESNPKIGNIKFDNFAIKVFYGGLEIGDAVFIPEMPQKTRSNFSISDIGFGLERLGHIPDSDHSVANDCVKTLALLSMSGVEPSNNNHGYRFRMFSKRLVSECGINYSKMLNSLEILPKMMDDWLQYGYNNSTEKKQAIGAVSLECQRNFNREILNFLQKNYNYLNEIDINKETHVFLSQLEKIGDKSSDFWLNVKKELSIKF